LAKTSSSKRPLVVRTDNCKEFLNAKFRKLLDLQGVEMRVCRNPDVKCGIVERINRTLKSKLYKWFRGPTANATWTC
jgi:glycerol dehydrogenase-like iron-containing ADH family enzyme